MLACKGLKLLWILKQYVALSSHTNKTKGKKNPNKNEGPSICKKVKNMRARHLNAHIHTQADIGNTAYVRTLPDKNIQRAIFSSF